MSAAKSYGGYKFAANSTRTNDPLEKVKINSSSSNFNSASANRKSMTRCKSAEMIGTAGGRKTIVINSFLQNQ
jgi:hypothetical protein